MTSLLLYMILRDAQVDSAFNRFKTAMAAMPIFDARFTVSNKVSPPVSAEMIVEGRKSLFFDAATRNGHYKLSISPARYREVDDSTHLYDEAPYPGGIFGLSSRMSHMPELVPTWMLIADFKKMMPDSSSATYGGKTSVDGRSCDLIKAEVKTPVAQAHLEICIGDDGLVYRFTSTSQTPMGIRRIEWVMKSYRKLNSVSPSVFENRIPDGYMPYSLPDRDLPPEIGKKLKLSGWVNAGPRRPWSQPTNQPLLFVLLGQDSVPSARALAAIKGWQQELQRKHVAVALATDQGSEPVASHLLVNPSGDSLKALDAPATPMFFLLDSSGTLRNLWMGFDPSQSAKLHRDLIQAIGALK